MQCREDGSVDSCSDNCRPLAVHLPENPASASATALSFLVDAAGASVRLVSFVADAAGALVTEVSLSPDLVVVSVWSSVCKFVNCK
jgi:hypothetical protein